MTGGIIQDEFKNRILDAIRADERIVGCVDYDSVSEGRGDEWLERVMFQAESLGYEVCIEIARKHGWRWPVSLAEKVLDVLK